MPPLDKTNEVSQTPLESSTPDDDSQPTISLRNVSKKCGRQQTLANISLDIGRGEMLVVLGPSGGARRRCYELSPGLKSPIVETFT
jgi:ABC-type bacteriocin/lantibiotic exporter with double-glycine peptidase domain